MTAGIREMLACRFGKESVVDVLEGTKLEQYSQKLGFGLYVVKGAVETSLQEVWANGCDRMFQAMAEQPGAKKKYSYYRTVQGVVGECNCIYMYPGTQKHRPVHLDDGTDNGSCGVLLDSIGWLHDKLGIATQQGGFRSCQFNNVVATQYDYALGQYIPWHTDANELIGHNALIASVSLDSPGAFVFAPRMGTDFAHRWYHKQLAIRKEKQKQGGVRGVLPLFPGDVMIMCGTFQENMMHKTLPVSRITPSIFGDFPAVNPRLKDSLEQILAVMPSIRKRKRSVITFRRIVRRT